MLRLGGLLFVCFVVFCIAETEKPEEDTFWNEIQQQNVHRVAILLDQNPDLANLRFGEERNTALHLASQFGNVELLKEILKASKNVDAQNVKGETPIHSAIINDHPDCVRVLLNYDPDLSLTSDMGSPLMAAASLGKRNISQLLKQFKISQSFRREEL